MFKFNFDVEPEGEDKEAKGDPASGLKPIQDNANNGGEEGEHTSPDVAPPRRHDVTSHHLAGGWERRPVVGGLVVCDAAGPGTVPDLTADSDLVPNVYEGGLKVWECSEDLATYLTDNRVSFAGLNVIEVGCGAALPGLVAWRGGAASVTLQDYNSEVIEEVTIPTFVANAEREKRGTEEELKRCDFISGDWAGVLSLLPKHSYDVVLTSETIYSEESYGRLHSLLEHCLAPGGVVYLAAKSHYFGVGGGVDSWRDYVTSAGVFGSRSVWQTTQGLTRHILAMERRSLVT